MMGPPEGVDVQSYSLLEAPTCERWVSIPILAYVSLTPPALNNRCRCRLSPRSSLFTAMPSMGFAAPDQRPLHPLFDPDGRDDTSGFSVKGERRVLPVIIS